MSKTMENTTEVPPKKKLIRKPTPISPNTEVPPRKKLIRKPTSISPNVDLLEYISTSSRNHNEEWLHILKANNINPRSSSIILKTEDIKKCRTTWKGKSNQFEPRLLAKIDCLEDVPDIFQFYGLNIISNTNSSYLLTHESVYESLNYDDTAEVQLISRNTDSLVLGIGQSESSVIDNLRYCGLFESNVYLNEPIKYGPLLSGRHRCSFETHLQKEPIHIQGVQYETDGCYESENKILLIEGKSKLAKSFNLRQLYFPYRTIYDKKGKKEIIPIFIATDTKSKIFHIWKFTFEDPLVMSSIKCLAYNKYKFV